MAIAFIPQKRLQGYFLFTRRLGLCYNNAENDKLFAEFLYKTKEELSKGSSSFFIKSTFFMVVGMLQLQNVRKTYKTKAGLVNALDGVSLTFPASGLVFITGKSGCGKTTLLNVIGGLDGVDDGEILIQNKKFSSFSDVEYDSYRNTFVGFIFQDYNLLPEFTVEKNIKIAMELQGRETDGEAFEKLLKDVEIEELKNRKSAELSGGQRQRVAIARALVKQPRIIMADEPTGALDSGTGVQVLDILKKLSQETLVIVVSHDREFAEKYADRIVYLEDGKVVQDVTFTEREMDSSVSEQGDMLLIREGAELTAGEKDVVAKAVKERKGIEIVSSLSFREKENTGEVKHDAETPVAFRRSQMRMKSSVALGVKSLVVKPVRLVLTVLISALAFAVFGLFDTIANFNEARVLKNQLQIAPSKTVAANTDYIVDRTEGDDYEVKISQNVVAEFTEKTGGTVKGIFDLQENRAGTFQQSLSIAELANSSMGLGQKYYTKFINGFIEFDRQTEISENGMLSEGQRQLLCIARIMLALPPMLILDEATSSIDTRTEKKISDAFETLMQGRTTFIVAHRLSTIVNADVILVMEKGKVVQQGTHAELLASGGAYAELYNGQFA